MRAKKISKDSAARGLLDSIKGQQSIKQEELAKILGIAARTYRYRYKNPETFTVEELRRLITGGFVSKEELINIF
jgi:uncharacterized protein (DUF2384 family)